MKAAILVNGVPASGKSTVARAIAAEFGAPLMALDTVKEPLFSQFGTGDREHDGRLGRASYAMIFAAIADWPDPAIVVVDAWFGFQPAEILHRHLATAGIDRTVEIWCHAPGPVLAVRYGTRVGTRSAGHPGTDNSPELVALNDRARRSDTSKNRVVGWFDRRFDAADRFGVIGLSVWWPDRLR